MGGRVARPWSVLPAVVVAAMVVASPVAGQGGDEGPSEEPASAPDAPDGLRAIPAPAVGDANVAEAPDSPTDVAIRIDLVQILGIDERRSLFEVDAILTAQWVDKRGVESCTSRQVHRGENAAEVLKTTIWAPTFVIEFGREPRSKKALEVSVSCDGNVTYEERFTAAVTQRFTNLNDFPFDDHVIRFKVVPFGREGRESVRFGPLVRSETDEDLAAQKLADKFEAEEWKFEVEPGEPVPSPPSITTRIRIDRETRYYWMNIIAPLVFIVSISWIVLWMKPVLHERLGVSITILLTVVAFDFLTGDSLPKLSFTTRIDQFYNLSYLFVGLTIAVSFFATRRGAHAGGADDAGGDVGDDDPHRPGSVAVSQVDHWSRRAIPPAYLVAVVLVVSFGVASPGRGAAPQEPAVPEDALRETSDDRQRLTVGAPAPSLSIDEPKDFDEFEICASADETRSVRMERSERDQSLDPVLYLYTRDDRSPVAFDDDGAGGLDSQLVLPPGDECFVLVARDLSDEGTGSYTMTVSIGEPPNSGADLTGEFGDVEAAFGVTFDELRAGATGVEPSTPAEPLIGSIDEPGQERAYRVCSQGDPGGFVLMERAAVVIDAAIDPLLVLYSEDGSFVMSDDDGGRDVDSLLALPPGDECYVLVAGDRSEQVTGKYSLTVGRGEPPVFDDGLAADFEDFEQRFGVSFDELVDGAVVLGSNATSRSSIEAPGRVQSYRLCSTGRDIASVTMERAPASNDGEIDPMLVLYAENGTFVAYDDDGAGGLDSQLVLPPGDGCYLLIAGDVGGGGSGGYVLSTLAE